MEYIIKIGRLITYLLFNKKLFTKLSVETNNGKLLI